MDMDKKALFANVEKYLPQLIELSDDIFDHPEIGFGETYACELLCSYLEGKGFRVEKGVGGLPTSFRAEYVQGTGGLAIGFLGEYDALPDVGHACGHHLQTPAAIGAALAFRDTYPDIPCRLIIYGTPAEETLGGKIYMADKGCFKELDLVLANHTSASGRGTFGHASSMALGSTVVTWTGTPSHAGASPEKGRSALDAMMLCFHGLECMREHIITGCRIHYTVLADTGATNIVHPKASARITCRAYNKTYLHDMLRRMRLVVEGSAMMTETTCEIQSDLPFYDTISSYALDGSVYENALLCGAPGAVRRTVAELKHAGGGATDFGNVSWLTPGISVMGKYTDAVGHTPEHAACGKTQAAHDYIKFIADIMAGVTYDFLTNEAFRKEVRDEFEKSVAERSKI